jgi:hypothetical protein
VVYTEEAVVEHTLEAFRGEFRWLLDRSFWQGYSKRVLEILYPDAPDEKSEYLSWLLTERVPGRLKGLLRTPSVPAVKQLLAIAAFTGAVGVGYLYAVLKPGLRDELDVEDGVSVPIDGGDG